VQAIQGFGTEVDYIAGGYTGTLQILDKGVNKPFNNLSSKHMRGR